MQVRKKKLIITSIVILTIIILIKVIWVRCAVDGHGSFKSEKSGIILRANFMTGRVLIPPKQLLADMPSGIGAQFRGEWALYTCSMTAAALTNIAILYPDNKVRAVEYIDSIIHIVMSPEIREYDRARWNEDPLESLDGERSHISYISHLAWIISGYKQLGGEGYDELYRSLCEAMNRRILKSKTLNLPTYPCENIYMPDMLVAIVALSNYSRQNKGEYLSTVERWMAKAESEWVDTDTSILVSFLAQDGADTKEEIPVKGSYSALNCYYLTFIDEQFARDQYERLKRYFLQYSPLMGIKEYYDRSCLFGLDVDAGPIILNLSPSGTAFAVGSSTYFRDMEVRNGLLETAEIAGSTVTSFGTSHYLLSDAALVGEAIMLAMRTAVPWR